MLDFISLKIKTNRYRYNYLSIKCCNYICFLVEDLLLSKYLLQLEKKTYIIYHCSNVFYDNQIACISSQALVVLHINTIMLKCNVRR